MKIGLCMKYSRCTPNTVKKNHFNEFYWENMLDDSSLFFKEPTQHV